MNYFECKISYEKTMENGKQKRVSELYLIEAISFSEAESIMFFKFAEFYGGEMKIETLKRDKIAEIFTADASRIYRVKVNFITLDEASGKEKKTAVYMLVYADSIEEARREHERGMQGTMSDYEVERIEETKLIEIFRNN